MHFPRYRSELAEHPDVVQLPADQISAGLVRVAAEGADLVGFSVLLDVAGGDCELDGLFVEPDRMRSGIGRLLVDDAVEIARSRGAGRILVVANPDALSFYERVGFEPVGTAETEFGPAVRMALQIPPR